MLRGPIGSLRVIDTATPATFAGAAADWVCGHLNSVPASVLALPTGNTPLPVYAELAARSRCGAVRLDQATIFNLDEFCGLGPTHPHSFARYMRRHLLEPLGLRPAQVRLLRGDAVDIAAECRAYDAAIAAAGGIDACVLGLGANGHVAFNEPGTPWHLRTHVVDLSAGTRAAQRHGEPLQESEPAWQVPERGVTMGIATLLEARHILLLIAGPGKAAASAALFSGKASLDWPVSSLAGHPDLTVIRLGASADHR